MNPFANIPDDEIDRLLSGQAPEDSRLDGVAQFVAELNSAFAEEPTAALEASHIAAMLDEAHFAGANRDPAPASTDLAAGGTGRKPVFAIQALAAHKWAAAAIVACLGLLAFGGAAYAGALPEPVQEATASIVQHVGIHIPRMHGLKSAGNNGVRDHGAGVGNGKGQGGIHRNTDNSGQASVPATGTPNSNKPSITAAAATAKAARAVRKAGAKRGIKARANATAKTHKRVSAKKKVKRTSKVSTSASGRKRLSSAESDRSKSK